jgi:HD superfamily phosphodiesterase
LPNRFGAKVLLPLLSMSAKIAGENFQRVGEKVLGGELVALEGLFHDLGKFRQRAFWGERKRHETHGAEWLAKFVLPRLTS